MQYLFHQATFHHQMTTLAWMHRSNQPCPVRGVFYFKDITMFKHHLTAYLILKTIICSLGYTYSLTIGEPSSVLLTVTLLSAVFIPLMAWMEAKQ